MAIDVKQSDLYQNGRLIELENDEQLLLRTTLPVKQEQGDSYLDPKEGDELPLLAYFAYKDVVNLAHQYWWLIADRNNVFNPLAIDLIQGDGDLVKLEDAEIVLPNLLRQQPEFRELGDL